MKLFELLKIPKGSARFLDPHYNDAFKKKHPFGYFMIAVGDFFVALIPMEIYILLSRQFADAHKSHDIVSFLLNLSELILWFIGFLGSAMCALGLANIWMLMLKRFIGNQYLGHTFTAIMLLGGILVCAMCIFALYLVP